MHGAELDGADNQRAEGWRQKQWMEDGRDRREGSLILKETLSGGWSSKDEVLHETGVVSSSGVRCGPTANCWFCIVHPIPESSDTSALSRYTRSYARARPRKQAKQPITHRLPFDGCPADCKPALSAFKSQNATLTPTHVAEAASLSVCIVRGEG